MKISICLKEPWFLQNLSPFPPQNHGFHITLGPSPREACVLENFGPFALGNHVSLALN